MQKSRARSSGIVNDNEDLLFGPVVEQRAGTALYPEGSQWRKWDLHIHSPGTKLSDQFKIDGKDPWDEYCQMLHESEVQAFGITDYFSADGFFATLDEFHRRYSDTPKVFFPNVEMRLENAVNKAQEEVNVHLIFNPFQQNLRGNIKSFLQLLKTSITSGSSRSVKASELTTTFDFERATTTRAFIEDALRETYGEKADLSEFVLIITAANNDGIRPERGKKRKEAITDELDKLSDGFFGNSGNVEHYLSTDRYEIEGEDCIPKPTLSCSDAHSFDEVDKRLGKVAFAKSGITHEPTWIKADLTFEGLKQIFFEPENRVFIGEEPEVEQRVREHKTKYIRSLHVTSLPEYGGHHGTWFDQEDIVLGKELVAIIGNKGCGKSALADIIGLLGNSHNQRLKGSAGKSEELFSFLNREKFLKNKCASHFIGELKWYEGVPSKSVLDADTAENLLEKVEYLPQKYLERICANILHDEFRAKLYEVIFGYVKPQDCFGKESLDDLIKYLTQQADDEIQAAKILLHDANETVVSIERKLIPDYHQRIQESIRLKQEELDAHRAILPPETTKPESDAVTGTAETQEVTRLASEITALGETITKLQSEQIEVSTQAEEFRQLRQVIERATKGVTDLKTKYEKTFKKTGVSFDSMIKLSVDYKNLDHAINQKETRLRQIREFLSTKQEIESGIAGNNATDLMARAESITRSLICQRASLEERRSELIERMAKPEREYQAYLQAFGVWKAREIMLFGEEDNPASESLKGLQNELTKIVSTYREDLEIARTVRETISKDIFLKKRALTGFYDSIKRSIDDEIGKHKKELGSYDISIEASLRCAPDFPENFLSYVNQSVKGSFYGDGRAALKRICDTVEDWEDETSVFNALGLIVQALHTDSREDQAPATNRARDIFKQMKNQRSPIELYDYLFGFDFLEMKYGLKIDQKELNELSPGERGGLLLIFYLMLDKQDIPLVIDQPEDNLDNESVYRILVSFLKQAKKRRQIIMVTHNPNLAVGADAEQIIRVSIDKRQGKNDFNFYAGSIENPRINKAVVDILEGTIAAFDNRRLKYRRRSKI